MTPEERRRHVGDVSQLVSTRAVRLQDGNEDGVRAVDVRVSGGLSTLVLTDRGMDLGPTWVDGHQVSWQSPTGIVGPAQFDETNWLRSFHGGLLVTCGLQNVGAPNEDEGVRHGLHGRVSHIAARHVTHGVVEEGDGRLVAEVTGEVRETDVFGSDLLLRRRIRFPMGQPAVEISDVVVNQGYKPTVLLILYHINVGYPIVAEDAVLSVPGADVVPLNDHSAAALADHARFPPPEDGFSEMVYEHRLRPPFPERATMSIVNPTFGPTGGIGLTVTVDPTQLSRLWQWRMLGPGMYLTGLEPSNGSVRGRAADRAAGTLDYLAPGESCHFDVRIDVLTGESATGNAAAPVKS
jgi:hypothetical protein